MILPTDKEVAEEVPLVTQHIVANRVGSLIRHHAVATRGAPDRRGVQVCLLPLFPHQYGVFAAQVSNHDLPTSEPTQALISGVDMCPALIIPLHRLSTQPNALFGSGYGAR